MKYTIVKTFISIFSGILFTLSASAGLFTPRAVDVNFEFGVAAGDLQTARYDSNSYVGIGCAVKTIDVAGFVSTRYGYCQANDAEGDYVLCYTQNELLLEEIRAIDDTSWINFSFGTGDSGPFDGDFECTAIGSRTASVYLRD